MKAKAVRVVKTAKEGTRVKEVKEVKEGVTVPNVLLAIMGAARSVSLAKDTTTWVNLSAWPIANGREI